MLALREQWVDEERRARPLTGVSSLCFCSFFVTVGWVTGEGDQPLKTLLFNLQRFCSGASGGRKLRGWLTQIHVENGHLNGVW